jgi:hypothetical protein
LTTSSAVLLSELVSISATTSVSGADWIDAISATSAGACPVDGAPTTVTPRSVSILVSSSAAARAGSSERSSAPRTRESLAIRASYGPASTPATPTPQPGANRSSS